MIKEEADEIISQYIGKIFGFALSKLDNIDRAEELASQITYELYISLLKPQTLDIKNVDGYVYKIAHYTYVRFLVEDKREKQFLFQEGFTFFENPKNIFTESDYQKLRKEISYLGKKQRDIIVLHYFNRMKLSEIAKQLNISVGTVKWHLFDARKQLKDGLLMEKRERLQIKPISFKIIGHLGQPSVDGLHVQKALNKLIIHNILFSIYHEPKTISEIAKDTGIHAVYVEDEIVYLEENEQKSINSF